MQPRQQIAGVLDFQGGLRESYDDGTVRAPAAMDVGVDEQFAQSRIRDGRACEPERGAVPDGQFPQGLHDVLAEPYRGSVSAAGKCRPC